MTVQVKYVKTVVGWFNIYLVEEGEQEQRVNVSPEFFEVMIGSSRRVSVGCKDIPVGIAQELGFDVKEAAAVAV